MESSEDAPDNGGVSQQPPDSGEKCSSAFSTEKPVDIATLIGNLENIGLEDPVSGDDAEYSELHKVIDFQLEESPMTEQRIPKEREVLSEEHSKPSKPQSSKNDNKLSTPIVSSTAAKKSRDVTGSEGTAKSAAGSIRHAKQQPAKSTSYTNVTDQQSLGFKKDRKTDAANSDSSGVQKNLNPMKKGLPNNKQEGEARPSSAEETKPRRVGTLPNYGFSFRCDERAEKRREFYSKLEEKIHAKEMEKTTLKVMSKEAQEAEIKLIRKDLAFKAKPMPSFYQEPPPKVELKKISPTRAKSPKFSRRKSSVGREATEEDTTTRLHTRRLSLDSGSSYIRSNKVVAPLNTQKPKRKSLPFPSEKDASLSSISGKSANSSKVKEDEKGTSNSQGGGNGDAVVSDDREEKGKFSSNVETGEEAASADQDPEFASTVDVAETREQADDDASLTNGEDTTSPCVGTEKNCPSATEKDEAASSVSELESVPINEINDDDHAEDNSKESAAQIPGAGTAEDEETCDDDADAAVLPDVTCSLARTKREDMCSSLSESCETADKNADDDEEETTTASPIAGRETPFLTETSQEMELVPTDRQTAEVNETRGDTD